MSARVRYAGAMRVDRFASLLVLCLAACGGAVGADDDVGAPDARGDASDAAKDTAPIDATLFPTEDAAADAKTDAKTDAAADGGATKCATDADCAAVPGARTCCGGACVDTARNLDHCGGCGKACRPAHAAGACNSGSCAIGSCSAPWDDCNGNAGDGCEIDTATSAANCGACFHPCVPPSGTPACAASTCAIAGCPAGKADCNHVVADGCEVSLATDPNNCGACGSKPAESCNLADDDCDGACDDVAGCRVGVNRSLQPATGEHFYTTSLSEAGCCGFTVEHAPAYWLYAAAGPGLVPFYRCALATGFHFYTTSATCEGAPGTQEGIMGWIAGGATCGSTPLYRLVKGDDHFFTASAAERDAALASGYASEGTAGWVWITPQG